MKLISLNTWGGEKKELLLNFLKEKSKYTDIFCLQEIYHEARGKEEKYVDDALELFREIKELLPDFKGYFRPSIADYYGLAIFTKNVYVEVEGDIFIYKDKDWLPDDELKGNHARNMHYISFKLNNREITIGNVHGLWNGQGKGDSEHRIEQSKKIVSFLNNVKGDKILCGDFNLAQNTKSVAIIEKVGMRNLIKEHKIKSTRTQFYTGAERFADYIFTSSGIKINDFKVLPDEISDHSPLYLDFE